MTDHQDIISQLVPIVIEQSNRGERSFDIYSRLLFGARLTILIAVVATSVAVLIGVTVVWGSSFVVVRHALDTAPPLALLFWRFLLASAIDFTGPRDTITARSTTFCSSRTFPGHDRAFRTFRALGAKRRGRGQVDPADADEQTKLDLLVGRATRARHLRIGGVAIDVPSR